MKIALASARFVNGDVRYNLARIRRWAGEAKLAGADLLCLGEAFLQGFDSFVWDYERDREMAASADGPVFAELLAASREMGIDLMTGFLERAGEALYSSCALIAGGRLMQRYRRVSRGWKEWRLTDAHYREGDEVSFFDYRGRRCQIALCGDLWECPERFRGAELLFWPVYVNFSRDEWGQCEMDAYARQVQDVAQDVLLVNSLSDSPEAYGGCCWFSGGKTRASLAMGTEALLMVEL